MKSHDLSAYDWEAVTVIPESPQHQGQTLSLQPLRRGQGHHRVRAEFATGLIPRREARRLKGYYNGARWSYCTIVHPIESYTAGTEPPGGVVLHGDHAAGTTTLQVRATAAGLLCAGDYLQLAGDPKVYELGDDTDLINGVATVYLNGPLRHAALDGEAVRVNGVVFHLVPEGEALGLELDANDGHMAALTLNFIEKL